MSVSRPRDIGTTKHTVVVMMVDAKRRESVEGQDVEQSFLKALNLLKKWADSGEVMTDKLLMIFTDAEMPEMDGYRLTSEIRNDPRLKDLYVVLHTSLSGSFNEAMVKKVGCDNFLSKFQPDKLVDVVRQRLELDEPR